MKIYSQSHRTVTYGNLIPGICYAYLVCTMSMSLGVFLTPSVQAVDAAQVPFITGKLRSPSEEEFVSLVSVNSFQCRI